MAYKRRYRPPVQQEETDSSTALTLAKYYAAAHTPGWTAKTYSHPVRLERDWRVTVTLLRSGESDVTKTVLVPFVITKRYKIRWG